MGKKIMIQRFAVLCVVAVALAGCGSLSEIVNDKAPTQTYVLSFHAENAEASSWRTGPVILVAAPKVWPGYDTSRIAYTRQAFKLDYFARNEWADHPGRMLEPLLVKSLEGGGRFSAVLSESSGVRADLRLDTEIIRLQQEFDAKSSQGRVTLRAQLIDLNRGKVLGTRQFTASAPSNSQDPYGGVQAMNQALARVLRELAGFCGEAVNQPPR
jgi:cholesterol transport system auxiliary component